MQNQSPSNAPPPPSQEDEEDKEKKKRNAPKDEPSPKKKDEGKNEDSADIGGGMYQSLKRLMGNTMGEKSMLGRALSYLNPFKKTPKPPEKEIEDNKTIQSRSNTGGTNADANERNTRGGPRR
ncbi:MAG: hypothetical protein ACO1N3_03605 [Gammaproteobacteria bacterium]